MSRMLLGLAVLTLVSACGVKGDLVRPDPMWNRDEAIRRECQHQIANNQRTDARCARYQTGVQATTPSSQPTQPGIATGAQPTP